MIGIGKREMSKNREQQAITVSNVQGVTPHNKALYEAGKCMLVESVNIGREFCKFMSATAVGSIPVYIALLNLILPEDHVIKSMDEIKFFFPVFLFLVSGFVFVIGYFPQKGTLSLDLVGDIERDRRTTIIRRQRIAYAGFSIYCITVLFAAWILVDTMLHS